MVHTQSVSDVIIKLLRAIEPLQILVSYSFPNYVHQITYQIVDYKILLDERNSPIGKDRHLTQTDKLSVALDPMNKCYLIPGGDHTRFH